MRFFGILLVLSIIVSCTQKLSTFEQEIRTFREEYVNGFLEEERSPLEKSDFKHLHFFIPDSTFKVEANYELLADEEAFDVKTSSGKIKEYRKYALLNFSINENDLQLFAYESMKYKDTEEYKDYLFLPFTDLTNGDKTYGGGRYIDLMKSSFENGTVFIDFNKCYNPWCAYSAGYNCPIPPSENDLNIAVLAGEMKFSGAYKHKNGSDISH